MSEICYDAIIDDVDTLTPEQLNEIKEGVDMTSPGEAIKWILRKLREYAYPSS